MRYVRQQMSRQLPSVGAFFNGTIIYVLSRQWIDLFATHLLRLHPLPYCSQDDSHLPCGVEAPALEQAAFAGATLVVALLAQRFAKLFDARRYPSAQRVPQMAGMCAGWACGGALLYGLI